MLSFPNLTQFAPSMQITAIYATRNRSSETCYDENKPITSDPCYNINGVSESYFPHLNVKTQKAYHYVQVAHGLAETGSLAALVGMFPSSKLASVTQTDYLYDENYKLRGITSLLYETRVLDPASTWVSDR